MGRRVPKNAYELSKSGPEAPKKATAFWVKESER